MKTPTKEEIHDHSFKSFVSSYVEAIHDGRTGYQEGFKDGAEWMKQQLEPLPIDVAKRLPPFGEKVLCFGHEMAMNPQMGGFYWFVCSRIERLKERHQQHLNQHLDENGFKRATVTHWMTLPEPPKED